MDEAYEVRDLHVASCAIWNTNDDPCDCDPPQQRPRRRFTTAELIDLIDVKTKEESS